MSRPLRSFVPICLGFAISGLACEPLDDGGGAGLGFRLAFIRAERLLVSDDDGNAERTLTGAGSAADPAVSGQSIAYLFAANPASEGRGLYRTSFLPDAPLDLLATPPAGETFESPVWAPDGASLVVVVTDGATSRLVRVAAEGGEPEPLVAGVTGKRFPAFLSEDELVVVDDVTKEIELLTLSSGAVSPLGGRTESRPAVSRDGTLLAFADADDGGRLVVVELATNARRPLGALDNASTLPAFSPDAQFLGFVNGSFVYALPVDGSSESPTLLQSGGQFAWGT